MSKPTQIVFDGWNTYVAERDGAMMFISFDDEITRGAPPADLALCARIWIPIHDPNDSGAPVSPESEVL